MRLDEYAVLDGCALAQLIDKGDVQAREIEDLARAAVSALNPSINAVIELFPESATRAPERGPFHGVPFLRKDLLLQEEGELIAYGSRLAAGVRGKTTSELVRRQRAAGLVMLGRTATPEFGFSVSTEPVAGGAVCNPWDLRRSAGGSSGGAAAAVAAGMVPMAHANDGGGSIRIPAACCGLVGLKPSRGRVSLGPGLGSVLFGLGVEHAITRTVRDCAALLDATHGPLAGDPFLLPAPLRSYASEIGADVEPLRIAFTRRAWSPSIVDAEVADAVGQAAHLCAGLGHCVEEADLTIDADAFRIANLRLWTASTAYAVEKLSEATGRLADADMLEAATLACYDYGRALSAVQVFEAESTINAVSRQVACFFDDYDVLLTPTLAKPVAWLGTFDGMDSRWTAESWNDALFDYAPFTALFNATGQPALSLPLAWAHDGLPIGLQFVGRFGREDVLLRLAASLEQAAPWFERRPNVWAGSPAHGAGKI